MSRKTKSDHTLGRRAAQPEAPDWRRIRWLVGGVIAVGIVIATFIVVGSLPHRLTAEDRAILDRYENIRAALAHDDLAAARKEAALLAENWAERHLIVDAGRQLTGSDSLETARLAFSVLSKEAVSLAARNSGYYVMHCKMPCPIDCNPCLTERMGKWVQRAPVPENPFMGLAQLRCGVVDASASRP